MIKTVFTFVMANAESFAAFSLIFIAITSLAAVICMSLAMVRLHTALDELKRARMEIRGHAPLQANRKKSFDERRKEEYEKRGIPWEG